ncbi:hypothetical protein L1887_53404 [Cichorium endivia]|nr:hypothetical protein L1887_53404 [Cichorium endivia]
MEGGAKTHVTVLGPVPLEGGREAALAKVVDDRVQLVGGELDGTFELDDGEGHTAIGQVVVVQRAAIPADLQVRNGVDEVCLDALEQIVGGGIVDGIIVVEGGVGPEGVADDCVVEALRDANGALLFGLTPKAANVAESGKERLVGVVGGSDDVVGLSAAVERPEDVQGMPDVRVVEPLARGGFVTDAGNPVGLAGPLEAGCVAEDALDGVPVGLDEVVGVVPEEDAPWAQTMTAFGVDADVERNSGQAPRVIVDGRLLINVAVVGGEGDRVATRESESDEDGEKRKSNEERVKRKGASEDADADADAQGTRNECARFLWMPAALCSFAERAVRHWSESFEAASDPNEVELDLHARTDARAFHLGPAWRCWRNRRGDAGAWSAANVAVCVVGSVGVNVNDDDE